MMLCAFAAWKASNLTSSTTTPCGNWWGRAVIWSGRMTGGSSQAGIDARYCSTRGRKVSSCIKAFAQKRTSWNEIIGCNLYFFSFGLITGITHSPTHWQQVDRSYQCHCSPGNGKSQGFWRPECLAWIWTWPSFYFVRYSCKFSDYMEINHRYSLSAILEVDFSRVKSSKVLMTV